MHATSIVAGTLTSALAVIAVVIAAVVLVVLAVAFTFSRLFRKVPQSQALVVSRRKDVVVTFTGMLVIPVIHKAEIMDISVKTVKISRRGRGNGLICADNIRADIDIEFYVKVNGDEDSVRTVAKTIGCERASGTSTLAELFESKFSEALKTAGKQFEFEQLYTDRQTFRDQIISIIGKDLNGYVLEDVAIDYLEQTSLAELDPDNILDADGIRKITERTATQHIETNKAREFEREETTRRTVDADKAVLEMERDRAEATARQQQEVRTVQAAADAAAAAAEADARQRAESARITADQVIGVAQENKDREVKIAGLNRDRTVAVQSEEIERDRQLAVTGRNTAVAEAQKAEETRRRELADVARDRVTADLGVAEQEERIATLRVVEDAQRQADAVVRTAEGSAQAEFVGTVKQAEAGKAAAASEAERTVALARADAAAAEQEASAARRRAEGAQAQAAAAGLATVQVERERAAAIRDVGLAEVEVDQRRADAIREVGVAEGEATRARLAGEGEGLSAKAAGVKAVTEAGRGHEEFRLQLDKDQAVEMAAISARADVAKSAAEALGTGLSNADMTIVSDASIVDRILSAAGHGQALDGFLESSQKARKLLAPYLDGDANIVADVAAGIGGVGAAGIRDLTVARFVSELGTKVSGDAATTKVIDALRAAIDKAGIGEQQVIELVDPQG
jgi:uncharacterized membrane protein YqiK